MSWIDNWSLIGRLIDLVAISGLAWIAIAGRRGRLSRGFSHAIGVITFGSVSWFAILWLFIDLDFNLVYVIGYVVLMIGLQALITRISLRGSLENVDRTLGVVGGVLSYAAKWFVVLSLLYSACKYVQALPVIGGYLSGSLAGSQIDSDEMSMDLEDRLMYAFVRGVDYSVVASYILDIGGYASNLLFNNAFIGNLSNYGDNNPEVTVRSFIRSMAEEFNAAEALRLTVGRVHHEILFYYFVSRPEGKLRRFVQAVDNWGIIESDVSDLKVTVKEQSGDHAVVEASYVITQVYEELGTASMRNHVKYTLTRFPGGWKIRSVQPAE